MSQQPVWLMRLLKRDAEKQFSNEEFHQVWISEADVVVEMS